MRSQAKAPFAGSTLGRGSRAASIAGLAVLAWLLLGAQLASAAEPAASIDPAPAASYVSAHVTGSVDPQDQDTTYYFQYSTDPATLGWSYGAFQGPIPAGSGAKSVSDDLTGLQPGATYVVQLVAFSAGGEGSSLQIGFETKAVAPPLVSIDSVDDVTATGARFSGEIAPGGTDPVFDVDWSFQCVPECPGVAGGHVIGDGSSHEVSADANGLQPNTDYDVSLVATTPTGQVVAGPKSFETAVSAPAAKTEVANDIAPDGATLRGSLNPYGLQTVYYFEYGTDSAYGVRIPVGHELVAGNGRKPISVEQSVAGLRPGTAYHYRLVSVNSAGTSLGEDKAFVTAPIGVSSRAFEMVSPVDKGGSNIDTESTANYQATPDGNRLVFTSKTALAGSVNSDAAPLLPKYSSIRGSLDWSAPVALDPAQIPGSRSFKLFTTFAVSEDGTKALGASLKALAPGASEGDSNLYLRDTTTGALTTIGMSPGTRFDTDAHFSANFPYAGGTPDFSHVVFSGINSSFLPGTPAGSLYEWTGGELRLVTVAPDGTPFEGGALAGIQTDREPHYVSDDGSKVFFNQFGVGYVRINGTSTVPVGGFVRGASRDGSVAIYDPLEENNLYRFDVNTGTSTLIAPSVDAISGVLQVSEDASSVYFASSADLAPGGSGGGSKIYLWHDGEIDFVSPVGDGRMVEWMASPNGRYFAFTSYSQLTGYDNTSAACQDLIAGDPGDRCRQAYRYDAATGDLTCASCRLDTRRPTGNAHIGGIEVAEFSRHFPRSMLDNGELLFDTPDSLSARDTNSKRDVYSFDGERATLISAGRGDGDSQLADASLDGENVFFTTGDQLVGQDTDTLVDVYDARVGGGLASQNPPPARGGCIRDDCKATPSAGRELPFGGSEGLSGVGNLKAKARKRCGAGRHRVKARGKSHCVKQRRGHANRRPGR